MTFCDQDGILAIEYLPKGQTINAEYCTTLQVHIKDILKKTLRGNFTKGVLFLHENAQGQRSRATKKKLAYLGFQCVKHLPYSPDLAPLDYHLYSGLKKHLKGRHFSSDEEVSAAAETCLGGQHSELFMSVFKKLEQRAKRCIELDGEYVERSPSLVAVACFLPGRVKDISATPRM